MTNKLVDMTSYFTLRILCSSEPPVESVGVKLRYRRTVQSGDRHFEREGKGETEPVEGDQDSVETVGAD